MAAAGARAYAHRRRSGLAAAAALALPGPRLPEWLAPLGLVVPGQLLTEALSRRLRPRPGQPARPEQGHPDRVMTGMPEREDAEEPSGEPRRFLAAVFDLDGTLVDSETRSHESWRHVFRSRGIVPDDDLIRAFVGRRGVDVHDLLREQVPEHDPAELMAASSAHFHAPHQPPLGPLAGAVELVRQISAAGVPLALVTSAGRATRNRP